MQTLTNQKVQRRLEAWGRVLELLAGWDVSLSAAGEAMWQSGVLEERLGHLGSSGQCSLPVNTELLEYFSNKNVHLGVWWLKIRVGRNPTNDWTRGRGRGKLMWAITCQRSVV